MKRFGCILLAMLPQISFITVAQEAYLQPQAGETELYGTELDKLLDQVQADFQKQKYVRAKLKRSVDGLLGPEVSEGTILIRRPGDFLIQIEKPRKLATRLIGTMHEECIGEKVKVSDFSKAQQRLALLRGAVTGDIAVLKKHADLKVFKTAGEHPVFRIVLIPRGAGREHQAVIAKVNAGAAIAHELQFIPRKGHANPKLEEYFDIEVLPELTDADLSCELLKGKEIVKEVIPELKSEDDQSK